MDSFIFYRSFYEALKELPDNERLEIYDVICEYGLDMSEMNIESPIVRGMFALIKPQIDANYKRKMDGKKGGRPKSEPVVNQKENHRLLKTKTSGYAVQKPNVNVNVNVNDNVNANVNVIKKHKYGEYQNVLLSDDELEKLKKEFPNDYQKRIEKVSVYCASTGKSYKNYLATIRNWARNDKPVVNDELPTYDSSNNPTMSEKEKEELLKMMGRA